jgi:hypothetical protein
VSVRELGQDYLNDYIVNEKSSFDKAQRMVKRFDDKGEERDSELMEFFGDSRAHTLTTDLINHYIAKRKVWRRRKCDHQP